MTNTKIKKRALNLNRVFTAIDCKDRHFPDSLNENERKEFSAYISMRWASGIEGSYNEQVYYLRSTNERANFNFFDISRHPKLQWLLCTTVSPNIGKFRHYWVNGKTKTDPIQKFIETQFPHLNDDEISLLASNLSIAELKEYARNLGWDEKEIQQLL